MPDVRHEVTITATETIVYQKTYPLEDLLAYLTEGTDEVLSFGDFDNDPQLLAEAVQRKAHSYDAATPGFAEDLERNGDVQGQEWTGNLLTHTKED